MKKNIYFGIGFLILSLATAYMTSLPTTDADSNEVVWLRLSDDMIQRLDYKSKTEEVEIFRNADAGNRYWVAYKETPKDGKTDEEQPAFMASDKIAGVMELFQPLKVLRVIGDESSLKLEDFGFDSDEGASLQISNGKQAVLDFKIGKRSFGSRNYFVLDQLKKKVLLINGSRLEDISKAKTRLYERRPYEVDFADVDAAKLTVASRAKDFWRTKKDKEGALGWSDASEDGAVKASYNGWMRKVQNLRVIRFADKAIQSDLSAAEPVFTLSFLRKGGEVEAIRFYRIKGGDGKNEYWLSSTYIVGFAKIDSTKAETIEKDVPVILGES